MVFDFFKNFGLNIIKGYICGLTEKTPFLHRYFEVLGQTISCQLFISLIYIDISIFGGNGICYLLFNGFFAVRASNKIRYPGAYSGGWGRFEGKKVKKWGVT